MLTPDQVTAVIPTRGDQDLTRILGSLPYKDVIVHDNSKKVIDSRVYGRFVGAEHARNKIIYFQDDDIIFTAHDELLAAYEPDMIVTNMPDPWYTANQYDVLDQALVGAGSLCPLGSWQKPFETYLKHHPMDILFLNYCDFIYGQLYPHKRIDLGYEILPHASGPNRIYTQPGSHERKMTVVQRAIALRQGSIEYRG